MSSPSATQELPSSSMCFSWESFHPSRESLLPLWKRWRQISQPLPKVFAPNYGSPQGARAKEQFQLASMFRQVSRHNHVVYPRRNTTPHALPLWLLTPPHASSGEGLWDPCPWCPWLLFHNWDQQRGAHSRRQHGCGHWSTPSLELTPSCGTMQRRLGVVSPPIPFHADRLKGGTFPAPLNIFPHGRQPPAAP